MTTNQPKDTNQATAIAKLNELYISTRRKYLKLTDIGYTTQEVGKRGLKIPLVDSLIKRHLDGKETYGVFNGGAFNKFITFDIDYDNDKPQARWATMKIVAILRDDFNIKADDIHVSFSGNKGYHVDLFFDKPVDAEVTKRFYESVIATADLPRNKVEYRPTIGQGVKLPLGIHKKTGNRCWFVDRDTLEPIKTFDYLAEVEPMETTPIYDALIELTDEQEAEFERVVRETNTDVNVLNETSARQKAASILTAGQLLYPNTRHSATLLLASFFNSQGEDEETAVGAILSVLHNTPPEYFSKDSTPEIWEREAKRLVRLAFERNYKLGNADKPITIYKSEIIAILSVGTFRQKQLAYAMLVMSKRYGERFYLTMNSGAKMLGTTSKTTVSNAIKKLVEVGFIEYVRKGELDHIRSAERGHAIYKPNVYRILVAPPAPNELSIEVTSEYNLIDVTYELLDIKEIKQYVARTEFRGRWERSTDSPAS